MSPAVSIRENEVPRGGRITVDVDGLDNGSDACVELVLVERTTYEWTERARRHDVAVASVPIGPIGHPTIVPVPDDLPDPHNGRECAWFYEVVLATGRRGKQNNPRVDIHLTGDATRGERHRDAGPSLTVLPPRVTAPAMSMRPAILWMIGTIVVCALPVALGVATGSPFAWLVALFFAWLGFAAARAAFRSRLAGVEGVSCMPATRYVARGVPFEVDIVGGAGHALEAGLCGLEWSSGEDSVPSTRTFHETWVPIAGSSVELTIPAYQPSSYDGAHVGVIWSVAVRPSNTTARDAALAEYRTTVYVHP